MTRPQNRLENRPNRSRSQEDTYYKALSARDPRFDGKFFVGVKTTGIYCRPICPAKPKRENVEFFSSHLAAEKSGYRPCLRCRPESAPQSPAWMGKSATVQRATRTLQSMGTSEFNEREFADLFGVSARHLRRLFIDEIGKTPKQLFFENRLNLSRKLITETQISLSEIAFASGFKSIRRFNDAFKSRFKRNPSQLRRMKVKGSEGLLLKLSYRPPFDFDGLLDVYKSHQIANLEWFEAGVMHRIVSLGGQIGEISISNNPGENALNLRVVFPDTSVLPMIIGRVRAMFDLDSDPLLVANALETDPKIKKILRKHQGVRLPSGWDPFEIAIGTILGQLVSLERGRSLVRDLVTGLGEKTDLVRGGEPVYLFPSPVRIATADLSFLKTTDVRKQTLIEFSKAVASGHLSLVPAQDVEDFTNKLLSVKGIGPWTANYMALKVLRNTDSFPSTDLILARALELHPLEDLAKMSPWRGYAAALFWREYASLLTKTKKASQ